LEDGLVFDVGLAKTAKVLQQNGQVIHVGTYRTDELDNEKINTLLGPEFGVHEVKKL
jgi:hypothetical protein